MKKINIILRKCKTLSKQLSSRSLGSNSARHDHRGTGIIWNTNAMSVVDADDDDEPQELVFVGSTRKRYVISSKYLNHPLMNALMEKSKKTGDDDDVSVINCEVVLFDHLLWMLENADFNDGSDCFDELADMYSS
ncbi:auxin-responsive protein SAUR78-like [Bidens hawaiensis]|uniref:auxin-responsive protein SAUR78-like n=1 Tax=Bidens hawaiensis TaxID=980011 RepID=UPI0040499FA3